MHISVYLADQNPHRDRSLGISRYTDTLLSALVEAGVEVTSICSASSLRFSDAAKEIRLPLASDRAPLRVACDQLWRLWPEATGAGEQLRLYPKGFLPWSARLSLPSARALPEVAIVHDVILQHYADRYPAYVGRANLLYFLFGLERSLRLASAVVTVSQASRRQIEAFCARRRIPVPPLSVVPEASPLERHVGSEPEPRTKDDRVVHLAGPAPHKRTLWLLDAWAKWQAGGRALPALQLIGRLPAGADALVARMRRVSHVPRLSDAALQDAIAGARALLMPSEIEGFGLPVLEAYYLQTPACFAAGTAMDEYMTPVSRAGAFDGGDVESLFAALQRVLSLSPEAVWTTACDLRERYSMAALGQAMRAALSACIR